MRLPSREDLGRARTALHMNHPEVSEWLGHLRASEVVGDVLILDWQMRQYLDDRAELHLTLSVPSGLGIDGVRIVNREIAEHINRRAKPRWRRVWEALK